MAHIFDPIRTFANLKKTVVEGVSNTFPIETNNRILRVSNVVVDDSKADPFNYKLQKEIKVREGDYVAPVYGDIELVDKNTGQVIDTKKKFRLMDVPVLTDRYSYILGGNEYTVDHQLRMKPGVYTREKENGELESQFNMAKGGGRGFKMLLNPEDNIFKLKIGTANPPLYPILKALGIEDTKIKNAWGDQLFAINQNKTLKRSDNVVMKAYKSIFEKDAPGIAQATQQLKEFFDSTILSEETTTRTLGKPYAKVSPDALLDTSHRLLKVSRGEEEPDDRDSLVYKHIYSTPDLIETRIEKNRRPIHNNVKRVMDKKDKVSEIISKDMLNKPVRSFFTQGTVAAASEQTNPLTILANATKVTSLGEGAIGDMNAITDSMRAVNTSHIGVLDGIHTPESERIGVNLHFALGALAENKELKTLVKNPKTGKSGYAQIKDLFDKKVAFPDQYDEKGKPVKDKITIAYKGKLTEADPKDVDFVWKSPKQMFSYLSNLVPFLGSVQGNRGFMANKMLAQAIPLKNREVPLVQVKMPTGGTFENFVGNVFSLQAKAPGVVESVDEDEITVKAKDGTIKKYNLYNNLPLNTKSFIHSEARVNPGTSVKEGDILADSVYTKDGTLALGTNLRVGILPFKDSTFEDGYVISESAAKKLTSEHLREVSVPVSRDDMLSLKGFKAHYPTALNAATSSKLDADGIIRKGEIVEPGDTVIAHLQKVEAMPEDIKLGKLSKSLMKGFRNNAQIWDKDTIGKVVDVVRNPDGIKVYIRTEEPMQIGDKLVNRYGGKGIVSRLVPDAEMPRNAEGIPLEVAVSPSAIPGRINPAQVLETAISKVALKQGKPIKVDNFANINSVERVKDLLKEHKLKDKEILTDPTTGQSLGPVMVGNQYYLKLMHQINKKINARGAGPGYDLDRQPTKGGHTSARAMDRLTWNSLIAHGARENLYEMTNYKSESNPELWRNVQLGLPLPAPKTPFVFDKMLGYLAAGGVDVKKDGNKLFMMPLTDKEILNRSNGKIEEAKVVVSKNLRAVADGLFDDVKTGGLKGTKWTHIELAEPVLNPTMENAAKTLLGITGKQLDSIVAGKLYYDKDTKKLTTEPLGFTSGRALKQMLSEIDVDKKYDELRLKSKELTGQGLDKANKQMRYLRALKQFGMRPDEAYIINNVPVLPPQFRPMYPLANGDLNTAPINYLYRDIVMVNKQLKQLADLDDETKSELRSDLYKAVAAVQGLGDPLVQRGEKKITGAIEILKGAQPKTGFFQSTVFSKNQDLSGSSTVTPSTEMNPDEIMLPKDMAWDLYKPFIVKEMTRMGYKPLDANVAVKNRTPQATMALEKVVSERPVWINRAPSLHKFSILAVNPKLYEGKSIKTHPLIVGGLNLDHDGDTLGIYVPVTHKAIEEAKNFLPTRILEHAADQSIMLKPGHDIMTGLYYLTQDGDNKSERKYADMEAAMKDYKTKIIDINDLVTLNGRKTTIGKELVYQSLPSNVTLPPGGLTKSTIGGFLKDLAKEGSDAFRDSMDKLSKLSTKYNIYSEVSIGLDDLTPDYSGRDKILAETKKRFKGAKNDDDKRKILWDMTPEMEKSTKAFMAANPDNAISKLSISSGKPSLDQFKQLISTPFAVSDEQGRAVPVPLTKSFSEGLPISEYWFHTYGSRAGMIQKKMETAEPGYFAKQVISASIDNIISMEDCKTADGIVTPMSSANDVVGRYEAGTNRLIDSDVFTALSKGGLKSIKLRSPITCEASQGTCAMCYGLRENGQKAKIGDNVGALAGQFFSEPATQGAMKAFHCLHRNMLVLIERDGVKQLTNFKELWESYSGIATSEVEGQEEKLVNNLFVWDNDRYTKVRKLIRHKRHDRSPVVMARTQTNRFIVAQDNHPHMLATDLGGDFEPTQFDGNYEKHKYYCRYSFPIWGDVKVVPFFNPFYIGLYVTEGTLAYHIRDGKYDYNGVGISQNKDSISYGDCVALMKALPYEGKIHLRGRRRGRKLNISMYKYGRDLGELFNRMCGASGRDKHFPFEFIHYSDEDLSKLVCGVIDGDGCVIPIDGVSEYRTCISIELTSLTLIEQLALIADKLGITYRIGLCTVRKLTRNQTYKIVMYPKQGNEEIFRYSKKMLAKGTYTPNKNFKHLSDKFDYLNGVLFNDTEDYVYDMTTETHTLTVNGIWTHNTGAVLGGGAATAGGLERLQQLTLVPKFLKDKATLSSHSGTVDKIEDNPAGGKNIYVGGEKHLMGVRNVLNVKEGDKVDMGDALTDGPIKPQELLALKGIRPTQKYLVDSMQKTFKEMGKDMNRKLLETLVRSTTNLTTINDSGNHPYYNPGDSAPLTEILAWNNKRIGEVDLHIAKDRALAVDAGPYKAGVVLDAEKMKALKTLGVDKVMIKSDPIKHTPSIVSVDILARMGKDWLAKLNTNHIEQIIMEGAQHGDFADMSSNNPTGPYVMGTRFGHGKEGKY